VPRAKNKLEFLALSIRDRIRQFIEERFLVVSGQDGIQPNESLLGKGVIDSTGVLEFIDYLEEAFDINIADEELIPDNLDSINNVVAFIERKTIPEVCE
jgi:acyl carrier protein